MKQTIRLILVLIFQLNALNVLASMVEMDHSNIDNVTIAETQGTELDHHCDAGAGLTDHCHCVACFAMIESELVETDSAISQRFFPKVKRASHPYYGIYKPPQ